MARIGNVVVLIPDTEKYFTLTKEGGNTRNQSILDLISTHSSHFRKEAVEKLKMLFC
jgi:hypothetical protein